MPRQARERDLFGIYHVSQMADTGREIFRDERQREIFIETIKNNLQQYPCDLLAYCLIEPTQYHLILRFNGCDISQFMSSLNIRYTAAINESGMFRDRYRSELIADEETLEQLLDTLRDRSKTAKRWNSFCTLDRKMGLASAGGDAGFARIQQTYCIDTTAELTEWLMNELTARELTLSELNKDKDLRNTWICEARRASCLTQKEIGAVFGGLSESMVSKILNQGVMNA